MEQSSCSTSKAAMPKTGEAAPGTMTLSNSTTNVANLTVSSFNPPHHGRSTDAWSRMTKKEGQPRSPEEELQSLIDKGSPALQFLECIKEEKSVEVLDSKRDRSIDFGFKPAPAELARESGHKGRLVKADIPSERSQKIINDFKEMIRLGEQAEDLERVASGRDDPRLQEIKERYSNARSRERKSSIGKELEESRSQENKTRLSLRQSNPQGRIHSKELRRSDLARQSPLSQSRKSLHAEKARPGIEQTFAKPKQPVSPSQPKQFTLIKQRPSAQSQQQSAAHPRPRSKHFAGSPIKQLENAARSPRPSTSANLQMVKWQFHRNFVDYSEVTLGPAAGRLAAPTPKPQPSRLEKENVAANGQLAEARFTKNIEFKPFHRRESTAASSNFSLGSGFLATGQATPLEPLHPLKKKQTEASTTETSARSRDRNAHPAAAALPRPLAPAVLQPREPEQLCRPELQKSTPKSHPASEQDSRLSNPFLPSDPRNQSTEGFPHTPSNQKSKAKPLLALCTPQTLLFPSSVKESEELYEFSLSSHPSDDFEDKFYIQKKDSLLISEQKNEQRVLSYEDRLAVDTVSTWKRGEVGGLRELADRSVGRAKIQVRRADPSK
jgi:hypothetical protein